MSPDRSPETAVDPIISVRDLTKSYGRGENSVQAVDGISFDINSGTVVGILGQNGAGKTSTIKMMLGLVTPTAGEIQIAGSDVLAETHEVYQDVGAMLEGARNTYWRLTVRENLDFFASLNGINPKNVRSHHEALIERYELTEKADVPVRDLSRGMKQKVSLICTLARQTSVIFLDEPTLGLDVETSLSLQQEIRHLAEEESMTILLSSHNMDMVEAVCDRIIILHEGHVIADNCIENLVEVFQTQMYQITVEPPVSEPLKDRLGKRYSAKSWCEIGGKVQFEVLPSSGDDFYNFVNELQQEDIELVSIRSLEPDLENVFLEMTNKTSLTKSQNGGQQ
ncbi:ABC transporter ATP-binding protein [Natronorubrum halophilum]|uniref:ABC transporter ATP-binding protein n=1 Tax=Natronorubrum halophilum TaxID=1702106 RepID=UPI0010C18F30|nr:ABC transporter ATP-binding protein [Natronorubrum halophilum]